MDLLSKLINLEGISGNEHSIRKFIIKEAKKYFNDVKVDKMGNVVVRKKGIHPRVLLLAHMDEVGLMVKSIDSNGKISFGTLGSIDPEILLAQRVKISGKKEIRGVITIDEVLNGWEMPKKLRMEDLYVYTGLSKKELGKKGIKIGTYISFSDYCDFCTLGSKEIISGKALDDRIGCFVLLELMRNLKTKHEVVFVFTVQEEVGLYGAKASVFNLEPDYALAIDVTGHDEEEDRMILGKGPALTIKDAKMLGNKCLNDSLQKVAKKLKINLQLEVSDLGTTDATSIFAAKGGIPSAVLGVSVANLHTGVSVAHKKDIEKTIKVLKEFLKNPPRRCWD